MAIAQIALPITRSDGSRHWLLLGIAVAFGAMAVMVDGTAYRLMAALVASTLSLLTVFLRLHAAILARARSEEHTSELQSR